jgi:hypothetical protein
MDERISEGITAIVFRLVRSVTDDDYLQFSAVNIYVAGMP